RNSDPNGSSPRPKNEGRYGLAMVTSFNWDMGLGHPVEGSTLIGPCPASHPTSPQASGARLRSLGTMRELSVTSGLRSATSLAVLPRRVEERLIGEELDVKLVIDRAAQLACGVCAP